MWARPHGKPTTSALSPTGQPTPRHNLDFDPSCDGRSEGLRRTFGVCERAFEGALEECMRTAAGSSDASIARSYGNPLDDLLPVAMALQKWIQRWVSIH